MNFNPDVHRRRSIRLKNYDYSQKGLYFITICTHGHQCLFGKIDGVYSARTESARMRLNDYGRIVQYTWFDLVNHVDNLKLHEFIVMPNHAHGIIEIVKCGQIINNNSPKFVGAGSKPALVCRPPCHNYGNEGEIELETGVNFKEAGLQTGAGLEPARTEPARTGAALTKASRMEPATTILADSLRAELKPNHQIKTKPLPEIVRQLKTFSARRVNQLRKTPGNPVWQRNYYEHVIRNETAYCKISEYILNNPRSWPEDRYYKEQFLTT